MNVGRFDNLFFKILAYILYLFMKIFGIAKKQPPVPFEHLMDEKMDTGSSVLKYRRKESNARRLIIIDDDVGMFKDAVWKHGHYVTPWLKITDPDGGLELIYALREPSVEILGVAIMMGVASTEICVQSAKRILSVLNIKNVPILRGARSPKDLGVETEAARFIVNAVMSNPGKVEIIATGPLTNIATAMMIEPRLPEYWHTLHFATGEFRSALGEISDLYFPLLLGIPDLNTNVDVEATRYVLEHGGTFPIYPNEVMDDLLLNRKDYNTIKSAGTKLSSFIAYELKIHDFLFNNLGMGIIPHGVVPVALAFDPSIKCSFVESGILLKNFGIQGYAFVFSNDPNLPKHKIFFKISDSDRLKIRRKLIKRLI